MSQHGQLIWLTRTGRDGEPLWAYRYRVGGRDSKQLQRGGFASERDAAEALGVELDRLRREWPGPGVRGRSRPAAGGRPECR